MRYSALAFLFGASLTQYWVHLPAKWILLGIGLCGVVGLILALYTHKRFIAYFAFVLLGWVWLFWSAGSVLQQHFPENWIGKTVLIQGRIISEPVRMKAREKFIVAVNQLIYQQQTITLQQPQRVLLNWYRAPEQLSPEYGSHWQLSVRLKKGWGHANPGSFDFEKRLLSQKISYVGYVVNTANNQQKMQPAFWKKLSVLRILLQNKLQMALGADQASQLLLAMLVGQRSNLSPATWQLLQATGTSHLMAISGLHVGMIAGIVGLIAFRLWRFSARLCLLLPAPFAAALFSLLAATGYSALSGFALPTIRALLMLVFFIMALLYQRRFMPWQAFSFALWGILLFAPLSILTVGFWLSFAAVASIVYAFKGYEKKSKIRQILRIQWVISLLLAPLTLWFFSSVSLVGFVANLVAIPWVGFIVLPLGFLGFALLFVSPMWGAFCLRWASMLLHYLYQYLSWLSHFSLAQWVHPITHVMVLMSTLIGIIWLLFTKWGAWRWAGLLWLLPLFYVPLSKTPAQGTFDFTLLDVGQGLASVIRTQHHVLVYDTGPRYSDTNNAGLSVIIPYMRAKGLRSVSRIIVSHGDIDHSGGLNSLVQFVPVGDVLSGEPKRLLVNSQPCVAGQHWQWDGVSFDILSPAKQIHSSVKNDNSCVLKVSNAYGAILLTGDIERKTELFLVKTLPKQLKSDVLVVPHHGSLTSSSATFIQAVAPKFALFPVGYQNRFGFPKQAILTRFVASGVKSYLSWQCGALDLSFDANFKGEIPDCYRRKNAVYWRVKSFDSL